MPHHSEKLIYANNEIFSDPYLKIFGDGNTVKGSSCHVVGNGNLVKAPLGFFASVVHGNHNHISGVAKVHGNGNHVLCHPRILTHIVGNHNVLYGNTSGQFVIDPSCRNTCFADPSEFPHSLPDPEVSISRIYQTYTDAFPSSSTLGSSDSSSNMVLTTTNRTNDAPPFVECPSAQDVKKFDICTPNDPKCIICREQNSICITVPCMHLRYCLGCARILCTDRKTGHVKRFGEVRCPECRVPLHAMKRVHWK